MLQPDQNLAGGDKNMRKLVLPEYIMAEEPPSIERTSSTGFRIRIPMDGRQLAVTLPGWATVLDVERVLRLKTGREWVLTDGSGNILAAMMPLSEVSSMIVAKPVYEREVAGPGVISFQVRSPEFGLKTVTAYAETPVRDIEVMLADELGVNSVSLELDGRRVNRRWRAADLAGRVINLTTPPRWTSA
jgi:hypothetical protein